jgi:hypothetical protein
LTTGACVAEANVLYAKPAGAANSACTKLDPCSLTKAGMGITATKNVIKMASGTYTVGVDVSALAVTIYGLGAIEKSTISINGAATVKIRNLDFLADGGLYCMPGTPGGGAPVFDLQDVSFDATGTTQAGPYLIQATACVIDLKRTKFKITSGGTGIYASGELAGGGAPANRGSIVTIDRSSFDGGEPAIGLYNYSVVHMTNSVLFGTVTTFAALQYDSSATGTVDFSTFVNWSWLSGNVATKFIASNNVFYDPLHNNSNTLTGYGAEHHYDMAFPQAGQPNGTNNTYNVNPMLADPANKNFHLMAGSPAIDAADPSAMPPVDNEGTPRPQGPQRDIGAFEYK